MKAKRKKKIKRKNLFNRFHLKDNLLIKHRSIVKMNDKKMKKNAENFLKVICLRKIKRQLEGLLI